MAVQERLVNVEKSTISRLVAPRVDSTPPRDTGPEMSDDDEEIGSKEAPARAEGDTDQWGVNSVNWVKKEVEVKDTTGAVKEIAGDDGDDDDWIDDDEEGDDNDLLYLLYHPSYVRDESKRRRRWENKWEALAEAVRFIPCARVSRNDVDDPSWFHALDRQTDTTMILAASPPHTRKFYSLMSRSIRRDPALLKGDPISSIRRSFKRVATQRKVSRANHGMPPAARLRLRPTPGSVSVGIMGRSGVGSTESREDDLKRALDVVLGSIDALGNIYEERENRWREEMKRLNDDRSRVELLLSQTLGGFSGMCVSNGSGESTVNRQNESLILV